MPAAALEPVTVHGTAPRSASVAPLLLARLAVDGGATRVDLVRDLAPLTAHRLTTAELRPALETMLGDLVTTGTASQTRGRWRLTEIGQGRAVEALGLKGRFPDWASLRDTQLVAIALGLEDIPPRRLKLLARPDGLRAAVLEKAYGLRLKGAPTPARLRAQLAIIALERAFGNRIKSGLGDGNGLSAKAGRLLAAQLSRRPRDLGTDSRLVAVLAAEAAGAIQPDPDAVRLAVLREWVSTLLGTAIGAAREPRAEQPVAQEPPARPQPDTPMRPAAASRPDLPGFAAAVQSAAQSRAIGWPGNRKAFISHVWQAVRAGHPEWGLSEIEFKGMLAEAHRTGHVVLANADLKDKSSLVELQKSAIPYKNTVWHLVRVDD